MKNNRRWTWLLTAVLLTAAVVLSVGTAFARYRTEILGNLNFQVKAMEQLTFQSQQWEQAEDGSYTLTFSMAEAAENCRMYLAVSEGITAPESMTVTLIMPPEVTELPSEEDQQTETETEDPNESEEQTETVPDTQIPDEPIVLTATMQQITAGSSLYGLFGSGYVFRFCDAETGEELLLNLTTDFTYTLTIQGLQTAAEQTSLLRLFVEYA